MWLSRLELAPDAPERREFWREFSSPGGAHRAIWKVFSRGSEQARDFLFRQDVGGIAGAGRLRFFVLSSEPPGDGGGLWKVETKAFAPSLKAGDELHFSLRVSPTIKRSGSRTEGGRGQGKRHDVVMDRLVQAREAGEDVEVVEAIQQAGSHWLATRAVRSGFELSRERVTSEVEGLELPALRIDGYRQHQIPRRGGRAISFSTLDFDGRLVVQEPELFLQKIAAGFGPQKAFGCGLMLLRRA